MANLWFTYFLLSQHIYTSDEPGGMNAYPPFYLYFFSIVFLVTLSQLGGHWVTYLRHSHIHFTGENSLPLDAIFQLQYYSEGLRL